MAIDKIKKAKYEKEWAINNREKIRQAVRRYRNKNREKVNESNKKWVLNNKERRKYYMKEYSKKYFNKRRGSDPLFKLKCTISGSIYRSMKRGGYRKNSQAHKILGCSYIFFKEYIENMFTNGMNWGNSGKWEYDHIIPVSSVKTESELIRLNHYSNFQPLWKIDNRQKGAKIIIV